MMKYWPLARLSLFGLPGYGIDQKVRPAHPATRDVPGAGTVKPVAEGASAAQAPPWPALDGKTSPKSVVGEVATKKAATYFPNLDGLRFVAFFLVFLQHGFYNAAEALELPRRFGAVGDRVMRFFTAGDVGVSFFFVLSGFLITYLILKEIHTTGRLDVHSFYVRRALRIWPLYYLVLVFGFLVYPLLRELAGYSTQVPTGPAWSYFLFLSNFDVLHLGPSGGMMITNITWSVAIEEQFYLLWPLMFLFTPRRHYKYLFLGIILVSGLFRLFHMKDDRVLYFHTLSVISDMAVGGFSAYLAFASEGFVRFIRLSPRWLIGSLYAVGLGMLLFQQELFVGQILGALQRLVCSLFFAFIILEQNYADCSLFKMSNLPTLSRLGKYTYGLYLLHPIALWVVSVALRPLHGMAKIPLHLLTGLGGLGASLLLAYLSYHLYEMRFLSLKRRFSRI